MTIRVFRVAAALVLALTLQAVLAAHDIPDEIVVQSYVKPQQNQLQVLLRDSAARGRRREPSERRHRLSRDGVSRSGAA